MNEAIPDNQPPTQDRQESVTKEQVATAITRIKNEIIKNSPSRPVKLIEQIREKVLELFDDCRTIWPALDMNNREHSNDDILRYLIDEIGRSNSLLPKQLELILKNVQFCEEQINRCIIKSEKPNDKQDNFEKSIITIQRLLNESTKKPWWKRTFRKG